MNFVLNLRNMFEEIFTVGKFIQLLSLFSRFADEEAWGYPDRDEIKSRKNNEL